MKVRSVVFFCLLVYVVGILYNLYIIANPELCDDAPGSSCIRPLFSADERVDIHVLTSQYFDLTGVYVKTKWHLVCVSEILKGFLTDKVDIVPLWVGANVSIGDEVGADVSLNIPATVRKGGTLHAHIFVTGTNASSPAPISMNGRSEIPFHLSLVQCNRAELRQIGAVASIKDGCSQVTFYTREHQSLGECPGFGEIGNSSWEQPCESFSVCRSLLEVQSLINCVSHTLALSRTDARA